MIVDVCTFNGESELFEIRYNILKDFVDEFRVIEFDKTFSSKPKERTFNQVWDKVIYSFVPEAVWGKYHNLAISSPNTEYGRGAGHWITEFCQKESIKDCLTHLKDDDIVFIGDVDEIWDPALIKIKREKYMVKKIKLRVYSYWLNNRSNERFWGTICAPYNVIKNHCLNHLRSNPDLKTRDERGWHFTSMGGYENVKKKLIDSYTEESYATSQVLNSLEQNINDNKDFLGRGFGYRIDISEWPDWLKDNKSNYAHLLK